MADDSLLGQAEAKASGVIGQAESTAAGIAKGAGSLLDNFYSSVISDANKTISFKNIPSEYLDASTHHVTQAAIENLGAYGHAVYKQQIEGLKKVRARLGDITRTTENGAFIDELGSDAGLERLAFAAGYNADRGNGYKVRDWIGHIGAGLKGDEKSKWNIYDTWKESGTLDIPIIGKCLAGLAWCIDTVGAWISTFVSFSSFSAKVADSKATTAENNIKKQLMADGVDEGIAAYLAREAFNADASKFGGKVKPSLEIPKTAPATPTTPSTTSPSDNGPQVSQNQQKETSPPVGSPDQTASSTPPTSNASAAQTPTLPAQPKLLDGVILASLIPAGGFAAVVPTAIKNRAANILVSEFQSNSTATSSLRSATIENTLNTLSSPEIGFFIVRGLRASQSPTSTEYDNPVYGQLIETFKKQPGIDGDSTLARAAILNKLNEEYPSLNVKEMNDTGVSNATYKSIADVFKGTIPNVPRGDIKPWLAVHSTELGLQNVIPDKAKYLTKAELKNDAEYYGPYTLELAKTKIRAGMDPATAMNTAKDEIAKEADNVWTWFGEANGKMSTYTRYSNEQLLTWAKEVPAYGQHIESAITVSSDLSAGNVLALRNNYAVSTIYYNQTLREALLRDKSLSKDDLKSIQEIDSAIKAGKQPTGMEAALNIPMRSEEDLKKLGMTSEQVAGIAVTGEISQKVHAYSLAEVEKLLEIKADGQTTTHPDDVRREIARIYNEYNANPGVTANKNEIWYISKEHPMDITVPQSIQNVPEISNSSALTSMNEKPADGLAVAQAQADTMQKDIVTAGDDRRERWAVQRATVQAAIAGSVRRESVPTEGIKGVDVAADDITPPSSSPKATLDQTGPQMTA